MLLPGGLLEDGALRREYSFRAVTGALEMDLGDATGEGASWPAAVTAALVCALESLGTLPATVDRVQRLCVGDRRFLLRELQKRLGDTLRWYQSSCPSCGEAFDFSLDLLALPAPAAGPGYPFVMVEHGGEKWRFHLPTGADQEALAQCPDEENALRELLLRCWHPAESRDAEADRERLRGYGPELWRKVEAAFEAVSPDPVSAVSAACPHCGKEAQIELEAGDYLRENPEGLWREVHQLALHYHWSEADILGMGRQRRSRYLRLIDAARGMSL